MIKGRLIFSLKCILAVVTGIGMIFVWCLVLPWLIFVVWLGFEGNDLVNGWVVFVFGGGTVITFIGVNMFFWVRWLVTGDINTSIKQHYSDKKVLDDTESKGRLSLVEYE
jgi:hypothetical protein